MSEPGVNGTSLYGKTSSYDELMMLRARCSNLRHWCRRILAEPAAAGLLPDSTVSEILTTEPEIPETEGQEVVTLLSRGGRLPASHPLASNPGEEKGWRETLVHLLDEWDRLRGAFFKLYDNLYPWDQLTDAYFAEQYASAGSVKMEEALAEIEREFGGHP